MEFQFEVKDILPDRVTIIESKDSNSILQIYGLKLLDNRCEGKDWIVSDTWDATLRKKKENLESVIDQMGLASSRAQELVLPITTFKKLLNSHQQKLYIIRDMEEPFSVLGILKIGQKRLFICNDMNAQHEVNATCVLDFYIHESRQRCGYGHELFELMLKNENMEPAKLAIDRPSFKFLSFLSKHYNLKDPKPQANNFVVYQGFLERTGSQVYGESFSKAGKNKNCSMEKSLNSLQTVPVSSSNNWKCSCIGKCHHRKETGPTLDYYFKKKHTPNSYSLKGTSSPYPNKIEKNWGVYDALHCYSENKTSSKFDSNSHSSQCSLTPIDNENACDETKWTELESSWNVLGVKPLDYSTSEKKY